MPQAQTYQSQFTGPEIDERLTASGVLEQTIANPGDIAAVDGKLQLADREYDAENPDGLGFKILRKGASFAEQVTDTNTIYEIRYDFDLDGGTVAMPAGCVLRFVGGSISNGTLSTNPFRVVADNDKSILKAIDFSSSYITNETIYVDWFDFVTDGTTDNYTAFKRLEALVNNKAGGRIVFGKSKTYALKTIVQYATNVYTPDTACGMRFKECSPLDIDLNGSTLQQLRSNTPLSVIIKLEGCKAKVHDGSIVGDRATHDYSAYTNWRGDSSEDFEWNIGIHNAGEDIEIYNLNVSNFCGDGILVGGGNVSASVAYHGSYNIHDCEVSYCGRNGITGHSSIKSRIARTNIHHIGDYASLPGWNPMAGIDLEFEDRMGDKSDMLLDSLNISDCRVKAISIATNTFFSNFVCRDSLFKNAGLILGNLNNAENTGARTVENCVVDQTDTTVSYTRNIGLSGTDLINCEFKGISSIVSLPRKAVGCKFISTSDSTLLPSNESFFPSGSGVSFAPMDGCTIEVNAGFFQVYGQDAINDTFFHFMSNAGTPRFASVTFNGCRFKTEAALNRSNTNIGGGDIVYNNCDIEWQGSGNDSFSGYSALNKNFLNNCRLKGTRISTYAAVLYARNTQFTECVIAKTSKSGVTEDIYSGCTFYNCSGAGTGGIKFENCTLISDREVAKSSVLGISCYISSWPNYVFTNCVIRAKNFTSNTSDTYSTYYNCFLDIANAYLSNAKLYNSIVKSTTTNRAAVFVDSLYYYNDVLTPARSGTTADRPSASAVGAGFTYFDTDLGKMIVSNGTDWVNMDGSALS